MICAALLGLALLPAPTPPDPPHSLAARGWRFFNSSAVAARTNRWGAGTFHDTGFRLPLYPGSEQLLLQGARLDLGVTTKLSPASFHPGLFVDAIPLAPLRLRVQVQRLQFLGLFGSISELGSTPQGDPPSWGPDELSQGTLEGTARHGVEVDATLKLRVMVHHVVALAEQTRTWIRLAGVGAFYVEPTLDLLLWRRDRIDTTRATLGWLFGHLRGTHLILAAHWERYVAERSGVERQIAGVAMRWRPDWAPSWLGRVRLEGLGGWMRVDPHRQGEQYVGARITWEHEGRPDR